MRASRSVNFYRFLILCTGLILLIGSTAVFGAEPHKEAAAPALQTQTSCDTGQVLMDWTALPWPLTSAPGPLTSPQAYLNVGGSDVDIVFSWSDTYQEPYVYGSDAPIVEMNEDLRVPNNDTTPDIAQFNITFDPPVYLNEFTIGSLSVLNNIRSEYVFVSAFDDGNNIQGADGFSTSTYLVESGVLQTVQVPGNAQVSPAANVYRLQGFSDQPAGYDRVTLSYTSTPIERIELQIFGATTTDFDDALNNVDTNPISTTIEAFCFTDPGTLDVALKNVGSNVEQSSRTGLLVVTLVLLIASAYVWEKRRQLN